MKKNYLLRGNLSRMKLQATIGVNKHCDPQFQFKINEKNFKESISLLKEYSSQQKFPSHAQNKQKTALSNSFFVSQINELISTLFSVQENMIKILQYKYDPEMLADIYHDISQGYNSSPDLKATWLDILSSFHIQVIPISLFLPFLIF